MTEELMIPEPLPDTSLRQLKRTKLTRIFIKKSKNNLRTSLRASDWSSIVTQYVNSNYDRYWSLFKILFFLHFPEKLVKRNKNLQKNQQIKGTVSPVWDRLKLVWFNRAFPVDGPLDVLKIL